MTHTLMHLFLFFYLIVPQTIEGEQREGRKRANS